MRHGQTDWALPASLLRHRRGLGREYNVTRARALALRKVSADSEDAWHKDVCSDPPCGIERLFRE